MNKKILVGIFGLFIIVMLFIGFQWFEKEEDVDTIMHNAFEEFNMQSIHVSHSQDIIWVDLYNPRDMEEVDQYFSKYLSEEDSEKFDIEHVQKNLIYNM